MHILATDEQIAQHRLRQKQRLPKALTFAMAFVVFLGGVFFASQVWPELRLLAIRPQDAFGLIGVVFAPLLHGDFAHLAGNAVPLMVLGTLLGTLYPKTSLRALPLIWILSGLGTWLLGRPSLHLGASGLTHGMFFLLFALALLRRDRPALGAGMLAFFLYGGMLLTVLPREFGISWEYHLSGAAAGVLAAFLFRYRDPAPPRRPYSWEIEELEGPSADQTELELSAPKDVPILWKRGEKAPNAQDNVLNFPARALGLQSRENSKNEDPEK